MIFQFFSIGFCIVEKWKEMSLNILKVNSLIRISFHYEHIFGYFFSFLVIGY